MVSVLLVGCANVPMKLDAPGERQLTEADEVRIALSDSDKVRIDPFYLAFVESKYQPVETGPIWAKAFIGDPATDPIFTIESGEIRSKVIAAGFSMRYTYTASGVLTVGDKTFPVKAEGSRAAAMMTSSALRQAVELCVADAARKAKELSN